MSDGGKKEAQVIKEVTNELLKDKFATEIGQKATVERRVLENSEYADQLRQVLRDIANDMQKTGMVTKGLDYRGSFCVHVFASDVIRTAEFAPLTVTDGCDVNLADAAVHALRNSVLTDYGRRMQKKRSGF